VHNDPQFQKLKSIFEAALSRIDPYGMLMDRMRVEGTHLIIEFEGARHEADLSRFTRILVLGCGKASARMAKAVEEILGAGLAPSGFFSTPGSRAWSISSLILSPCFLNWRIVLPRAFPSSGSFLGRKMTRRRRGSVRVPWDRLSEHGHSFRAGPMRSARV